MTEYSKEAPVEFVGPVRAPDEDAFFDAMCFTCAAPVEGAAKISPLLLVRGVTVGTAVHACTEHYISSLQEDKGWHRVAVEGYYRDEEKSDPPEVAMLAFPQPTGTIYFAGQD